MFRVRYRVFRVWSLEATSAAPLARDDSKILFHVDMMVTFQNGRGGGGERSRRGLIRYEYVQDMLVLQGTQRKRLELVDICKIRWLRRGYERHEGALKIPS